MCHVFLSFVSVCLCVCRDEMDIRRFICSLRLFKKPSESLVDKFSGES